jgi:hypothetical protein
MESGVTMKKSKRPFLWAVIKRMISAKSLIILALMTFAASLFLPSPAFAGGTVNLKVSNSEDDAYEDGLGTYSFTANYVYTAQYSPTTSTSYRAGGLRFRNVEIPRGAKITSATLRVYLYNATFDDAYFTVYGNGDDDTGATGAAADFNTNQDVLQRVKTSAGVSVEHGSCGTGWYQIPENLKDVVQEVVNRETWNSGQPLVLLLLGKEVATLKQFYPYSYNQNSTYGAELDISYNVKEDPMIAYAPDSGNPLYSLWDGSTWPNGSTGPTMGASLQWIVAKANETEHEKIMGALQYAFSSPHMWVSIWDGTVWDDGTGGATGDSKDMGVLATYTQRCFDIAYEANSGRALVLASTGTSVNYWIWNGSSWENSGNPYTYSPAGGTGNILWVKLAAKPYSNEIAMITADSDGDVYGNIWDGDTDQWLSADKQLLDDQASYTTGECVAVEYIRTGTNAGKAMFVWGAGTGGVELQSRTWDGGSSAWDSEYSAVDLGMQIRWLSLKADPNSNKLVLISTGYTTTHYVKAVIWNGTGWGSVQSFDRAYNTTSYRCADAAFETASGHEGHILAVYGDQFPNTNGLSYQHYNGTSWSGEQTIQNDTAKWAQVEPDNSGTVHLAIRDYYDDLNTWTYKVGTSSWDFEKELTASLESTGGTYMSFMLTPPLNNISDITLREHSSNQQYDDQFDGSSSHTDLNVFRFSLNNESGSLQTVDEIIFRLSGVTGITDATNDLTSVELFIDGNGTPEATATEVDIDGSAIIRFTNASGLFDIAAGQNVDYVLQGDFTNLIKDDTLTISLASSDITLDSGGLVGGYSPTPATHTVDDVALLDNHSSGQAGNQFVACTTKDDANLFKFQITNNSSTDVTVDEVIFQLSSISGIVNGDLSELRIYDDTNSQDAAAGGTPTIGGASDTITFSDVTNGLFVVPAGETVDYILIGDVTNLTKKDSITISLAPTDVILDSGTVGGNSPTDATHTAEAAKIATVNHTDGPAALSLPNQRRLVRDGNGYWYAVWADKNLSTTYYEIKMAKSTNTNGTGWSAPVTLVGYGGIVWDIANTNFWQPVIEIDRARGVLHFTWAARFLTSGGSGALYYSKCKNLTNWNVSGSWYKINNANGYDIPSSVNWVDPSSIYSHSLSLDSSGNPHLGYTSKPGSYLLPYYIYGTTAWQTPIQVDATSVYHRYATVEVDSNDVLHYVYTEAVSGIYRRVYHKSASSPYTAFGSETLIVEVGTTDPILNLSMAADDQGNVHLICENDAQSNICGAYYNGSTWAENEAIDTLGWDKPGIGARLGRSGVGHVIISPADTADPDDIYYWIWNGSAWTQPETDATEDTDSFVSVEKTVPSIAGDIGYLFFDAGATTGDIYFSRILLDDVLLESPDAGQVSDVFDTDSIENDASLFRFQMRNTTGSSVTVNEVVIHLAGISGIVSGDLSDLRLNNGTGDVGGTPVISMPDSTGTITFSTPFDLAAGEPVVYTLIGDVANLVGGDTITISIEGGDITLQSGTVAGFPPASATHTADYEAELQISGSADDSYAREDLDTATENIASSIMQITQYTIASSHLAGGMRFQNVAVPQGASINRATLSAYAGYANDDLYCVIYGHAVDDAPDFATNTSIWSTVNRPRTTASVSWTVENVSFGWMQKDVTAIVQELVDRTGWASGNDLALLLIGNDGAWKSARFRTYDYNPLLAARLSIDWNYTPGAPTSPYSNDISAQSGQTNPSGITDPTPAFSAIYNDPDSGDIANKYRVEVNTASDFTGTVMWDSGVSGTGMADTTAGNRCPDIIYAGAALASDTTYYWRITFWDDDGTEGPPSATQNFTTGTISTTTNRWGDGDCGGNVCTYLDVTADNYMDQGSSIENHGISTNLWVGDETADGTRHWRTLINFDLSALGNVISSSSQIVSAKLKLKTQCYLSCGSPQPMDIEVFRVKKPWVEGTKDGGTAAAGESTWRYQAYNTTEWTAWGVDDAADRETTADDTVTVSTESEWYEWDVTDSLKYMFDNDEYYGWLLKWQLEDSFKRYRFWSSENGTAANSPYLEITFNDDPACGYAYKKAITIDHSKVIGDSGDTVDLVDFPVLIKESGTWLRNSGYTDGRIENASGYDIIFKDATETQVLAHEIEYYKGIDAGGDVTRIDSWSTGTGDPAGPYTVPAGSNRLLVLVTALECSSTLRTIDGVTFGTAQMARAETAYMEGTPGNFIKVEIWYLKDAEIPAGSQNFDISYSSAPTASLHAWATFENVNQINPLLHNNKASYANPVEATVNVVEGGMSVAGVICGTGFRSYTWGNGWSETTDVDDTLRVVSTAEHAAAADGTDTASATINPANSWQALVVASLQPSSAGELVAWVKIPTLDADANTVIYMYYGNSCVNGETQNKNAVWNSSYRLVQHLQETSGTHEDSTQNNNHSTSVTVTSQGSAAGQMDGADEFDGNDDYISVADDDSLDLPSSFTIETWARWGSASTSSNGYIMEKGTTVVEEKNYYFWWKGGPEPAWLNPSIVFGFSHGAAFTDLVYEWTPTEEQWYHVVGVFDDAQDELRLYIDGTEITQVSSTNTPVVEAGELRFGRSRLGQWSGDEWWNGRLDEIRISSVARTDGWIQTSFNSQNAPSAFYGLGVENNSLPGAPTTPYSNDTSAQSGQTNPTGITDPTPAFSAIYNDSDSGDIANKYRVEVNTASDFSGTVMWDSGASGISMANSPAGNRSPDIIYAGATLAGSTTYYWRIRFWDDDGAEGTPSAIQNFTTGTFSTTTQSWGENSTRDDFSAVMQDTYLDEGQPSYDMGIDTFTRVGDDGGSRINRTLIKFDLTALDGLITSSGQIVSAALKMKTYDNPIAGSIVVDAFRVKKDWFEGTKAYALADDADDAATWQYQVFDETQWTTAGCDDATDRETTSDDVQTFSAGNAWHSWDVTDSVKYFFENPASNFGWLLKAQSEGTTKYWRIYSSEHATAANRPYLEITYNNDPACGYAYKRAITIDHNDVIGDSGDTVDLIDFPVVIKESGTWLRNSSYTGGRIENVNGYDIIFKDSTETLTLAHEIEYYNEGSEAANGELVAWVKIPTLDANANTVIYMYYGNSCIADETQNRNAVWNSNYKMVQHLQETSGTHEDSTANKNHTVPMNLTATTM